MKKKYLLCLALTIVGTMFTTPVWSSTTIQFQSDSSSARIPKYIYGQFAEHLGSCIYGGVWVGPQSSIPNQNGYRLDVLNALKELHIPVIRWPGGCFADNYHWMDGIGPVEKRPRMVNTNWGNMVEDNSFGTHEFLGLCELLGAEPYISANVGSGTVQEIAQWVEYVTSNDDSPMASLRRQNGRDSAWHVSFWGIGNESWGCGGQMTPDYYSDIYRRYAEYSREFSGNRLFKIASGASDYDYNWTETMMRKVGHRMHAISMHYYSVIDWGNKGNSTSFTTEDYYRTLGKSFGIEPVIKKHCAIMDQYDPQKRIQLFVDEWGTWWDVEPGTNPGYLYQQQTIRDAIVAATTLNIFHRYTDRIGMSNIAQMVNVLQAMILTNKEKMVLTPTYYVYQMYSKHQNAMHLPLSVQTETLCAEEGIMAAVPCISATASEQEGVVTLSLTNCNASKEETVLITLPEKLQKSTIKDAQVLSAPTLTTANTFEKPNQVVLHPFTQISKNKSGQLVLTIPAASVVSFSIQ